MQMRKANRLTRFTIIAALIMALIAFVLGSAPFTPAIVLAVVALPLAIVCSFFGVWRLSIITAYWAAAAFLTHPVSRTSYIQVDMALLILAVVGIGLSLILYFGYSRSRAVR